MDLKKTFHSLQQIPMQFIRDNELEIRQFCIVIFQIINTYHLPIIVSASLGTMALLQSVESVSQWPQCPC